MALRKSKATRKGQITIPVDIREKFDIKVGDTTLFEERGDHIAILRPEDAVARTAGIFKDCARNGVEFDRDQVWDEIVADRRQRMSDDE